MNAIHSKLRGTIWWLVPLAALLVMIALETDLGRALHWHVPAPSPLEAKPVNVSLLPDYAIEGGVAKYGETVQRPLFVPTRRPAPVAVVEVAKPKMVRGQFALTGTTVAGERSLAFLKEVQGGKSRTVKQGDMINGLVVADVKPDRVRLTFNEESEDLVLKVVANSKMTPQPAGAPPTMAGQQVPGQPPMGQPQVPGQPQQPAVAGAAPEATETLAERRRAARAAQAAAAAAQEASASAAPPPTPPQANPPPQQGAAGAPGQPEAGWAQIYQRYQQRRN